MEIIDPQIEKYIEEHTSSEPEVLQELNRYTNANVLMPRMLSGHVQGRFLSMISKMINPRNVLEIGTYTGYSALCFSEGLKSNGKVITIDINEEIADLVNRYLKKAGIKDQVELMIGDARKLIPELKDTFDLVFIDADKINYSLYYDLVFEKVNPGGYILADNVLWSGKVVSEEKPKKDTQALLDFNKKVVGDERVEKVLVPLRDGLYLIRKK